MTMVIVSVIVMLVMFVMSIDLILSLGRADHPRYSPVPYIWNTTSPNSLVSLGKEGNYIHYL